MRSLVCYTQLPELWDIFKKIISISPINEGGFTLINAGVYLNNYETSREAAIFNNVTPRELPQITHQEFWELMEYFLDRTNEKFLEKKRLEIDKLKRKKRK